jgi:transposase, IS5 family
MRVAFDPQLRFDSPPIAGVRLNIHCRDEIIPILRSLPPIYTQSQLRDQLLEAVAQDVNAATRPDYGRPGIDCWSLLVLAAVRPGCNLNYDRLQDLAEEHRSLRLIMGVGGGDQSISFDRRCLRDNITLLSPDTLERLNHRIVAEGHRLVPDAARTVRRDSFVVAADIHSPTDPRLIGDGLRVIIRTSRRLAALLGRPGWRQHDHLHRVVKKPLRPINRIVATKGPNSRKRLQMAYQGLLNEADRIIARAGELLDPALISIGVNPTAKGVERLRTKLLDFVNLTIPARDQGHRRVLAGETVPAGEKLFSLFEPETRLIIRGKVPQPVEFGHRVLIVEDGVGFVCHSAVLSRGADDREVVVKEMTTWQQRLDGQIRRASVDRGFHSPGNQAELANLVAQPCLPVMGHVQSQRQEREATVEFREPRRRPAGVESAIGALQSGNGQKRCRDHTFGGSCRSVGLGVLGRNLQVPGKLPISGEEPKCVAGQSRRGRQAA